MRFSPGNAQHAGARDQQQDAFGFSDLANGGLMAHAGVAAVVADGMGGLEHGDMASKTAVQVFLSAYAAKNPDESIPEALMGAIQKANQAVAALAREAGSKNGLGTTLAAMVMQDDRLYWISAGDSRIYLFRGGRVTRLTNDHIYAAVLEEDVANGKITREEALNHPERASLTSYLGLETLPQVERSIRAFPLQPGDCAMICSDGLYRALSDEEIAATLGKDPHKACESLVESALAKNYPRQDNVTVVALRRETERPLAWLGPVPVAAAGVVLALAIFGGVRWWHARTQVEPLANALGRFAPGPPAVPPVPAGRPAVTVAGPPLSAPPKDVLKVGMAAPRIKSFTASPESVGPNQPVTLSWTVTGKVDTVTIVPDIGPERLKWKGSRQVTLPATADYTLTATGPGGSRTKSITVKVENPKAGAMR